VEPKKQTISVHSASESSDGEILSDVNVGIIGLGSQAQNHLSVLSRDKRVQIVGVADIVEVLAESTAKKYGCNSYKNYRDLIDSEKLDAIYLVTPNVYHYETLKYALSKRLNIFCEKPMVINLDHARNLVNEVRSAQVTFQVGHNRRFSLVYKKLKELIGSGSIKPYMVIIKMVTGELQHPPWGADPEISGGHLYDTTLHMLDMSRWLFGEVAEVNCRAEANVYPNILNDFWISLKHQSGLEVPVFSSGHASWIVPFERVEVIGDHSCAITEELNRISYTLSLDTPTQAHEFHYLPQTLTWGVEEEDQLFIDAVIEKKTPPVTVEDGFKVVEIIEACYRSVNSKKPVSIPLS
jgi:myo-inositol 2-dehydrogenase/D-chiro-inositol 1-dehydrogenase